MNPISSQAKQRRQSNPICESVNFPLFEVKCSTMIGTFVMEIKNSQHFMNLSAKEFRSLFTSKCEECTKVGKLSNRSIEIKISLLQQLSSCFSLPQSKLLKVCDGIKFYKMILTNLDRTMPNILVLENDLVIDLCWNQLSAVYTALKESLNSPISSGFSLKLLNVLLRNCTVFEKRERKVASLILINLVKQQANQREIILTQITKLFSIKVCSNELLELCKCLIDYFPNPITNYQVVFFDYFLLPMHSANEKYQSIIDCVLKYISLDLSLLPSTFSYLLIHWPICNVHKQILFLKELYQLIQTFKIYISDEIYYAVFYIVFNLINDQNSDLSQSAIEFCTNKTILEILKKLGNIYIEKLLYELMQSSKNHWSKNIRYNACTALKTLKFINLDAFNKINRKVTHPSTDENERIRKWMSIKRLSI